MLDAAQATRCNVLINIFLLMYHSRKFEAAIFFLNVKTSIFFPRSRRNVLSMDTPEKVGMDSLRVMFQYSGHDSANMYRCAISPGANGMRDELQ